MLDIGSRNLTFCYHTVVTVRPKWTGYQTSGWSSSDMQLMLFTLLIGPITPYTIIHNYYAMVGWLVGWLVGSGIKAKRGFASAKKCTVATWHIQYRLASR